MTQLQTRELQDHPSALESATRAVAQAAQEGQGSFRKMLQHHQWQTHLPPSPQGRLLAHADYCVDTGDIAHFINQTGDAGQTQLVAACILRPMEEPAFFLAQISNGRMAPATHDRCRRALERLCDPEENQWSYPPPGKGGPGRYRPLGTALTPEFARMVHDHEWRTPQGPRRLPCRVCSICTARLHVTTGRTGSVNRARVRLPGRRECHYLRIEDQLVPVTDSLFYGAEPLRVCQAPSHQVPTRRAKGRSQGK